MTSRWDNYDYDELVDVLSDYHKDVHGFRMNKNGQAREDIIYELTLLDRYMEARRSTVEGREQLRSEGWLTTEPLSEDR